MDYIELSNLFSVLYNNITSNQAPGLTEYEKSVFLTKAQDEVLKNYFNPKGNKYQEGFDGNQKRQIDFSAITNVSSVTSFGNALFDERANSKSATLPDGVWMIVNEKVQVARNGSQVSLTVIPVTFDEYDRLMSKVYKRPLLYQAWRLIHNQSSNQVDLVVGPTDVINKYTLRYIRKPKPIIVGDLDGLSIDGYTFGNGTNKTTGCELDSILHEEIVQRAVELAKISWTATSNDNVQTVVQAGQRSE
jgi:hypothetical protein